MAFPSVTTILDTFNRTDESPASGWSPAIASTSGVQVVSNKVVSSNAATSYAYAYWNAGMFDASQEAFVTLTSTLTGIQMVGLLLRWTSPSSGSENGFLVQQDAATITIWDVTNGSFTQLGSGISNIPVVGDKLGVKVIGNLLVVYFKAGSDNWVVLGTRDASSHNNAGYIGINFNDASSTADDFGGGSAIDTFPTTSVLDDFNRADSGNLGSNWTEPIFTVSGWGIGSNQASGGSGTGSAYWNVANYGPNVECYMTLNSANDSRFYLRLENEGSNSATGYAIYRTGSSVYVFRNDSGGSGNLTQLGASISQNFAAGHKIGASMVGDTIEIWYDSGSGWYNLGVRTDSTYNSAGKLGIFGSFIMDDFGGGTIAPPATDGGLVNLERLPIGTFKRVGGSLSGNSFLHFRSQGSIDTGPELVFGLTGR